MGASFTPGWRLAIAGLFAAGCVAILSVAFPANNLLIGAAIIAVPTFLIAATSHPELFLVGCAFMPQWKNAWPLDRFTGVGDLTLVMLLGLLLGVIWRTLRHVGRVERDNLPELFRGQWLVI